jgi:hypothetical protein
LSQEELIFEGFVGDSMASWRQNLKFDPELLYIGAMFHDLGLTRHRLG